MRGSIAAEAASSKPAVLELYAYTSTYAGAPEDVEDVLAHITQVAVKHNAHVVRAAGGGVTNVEGAR